MIDCRNCGSESLRLEGESYVCARCGKKYTKEMAEQRKRAFENLNRKKKLLIAMLCCCFLFMVASTILLPGYASTGSYAILIYICTALCLAFFIAAVVVRILFGKARKELYSRK